MIDLELYYDSVWKLKGAFRTDVSRIIDANPNELFKDVVHNPIEKAMTLRVLEEGDRYYEKTSSQLVYSLPLKKLIWIPTECFRYKDYIEKISNATHDDLEEIIKTSTFKSKKPDLSSPDVKSLSDLGQYSTFSTDVVSRNPLSEHGQKVHSALQEDINKIKKNFYTKYICDLDKHVKEAGLPKEEQILLIKMIRNRFGGPE